LNSSENINSAKVGKIASVSAVGPVFCELFHTNILKIVHLFNGNNFLLFVNYLLLPLINIVKFTYHRSYRVNEQFSIMPDLAHNHADKNQGSSIIAKTMKLRR